MQKLFRFLLVSFLIFPFGVFPQSLEDALKKPRYVMDVANVISPQVEYALMDSIIRFEKSTSNQIVFLTLTEIPDNEDEFSFSMRLADSLKIGQAKKSNGVFVILTTGQRRVFKIYPGRGLEGALPDALIDRFFRNVVRPLLKNNQIDEAMMETYSFIALASRGEYTAEKKSGSTKIPPAAIFIVIAVFFIFYFFLSRIIRKNRNITTIGGRNHGSMDTANTLFTIASILGSLNRGGRSSHGGWGSSGGGSGFGGFTGGGGSFGGGGGGGSW